MPLSPNTRLGNYEIIGPLGAGGMGEVYTARDLRLGRNVAVKVLPAEVASFPDRLARLEREARTVARLNHPNIVTLFSVEDNDGIRFLTMELVDGQTLSDLVAPGGLSLPHFLELTIPLTDALAAAHELGVIHRDLKPGNIMVRRDGKVKILDFGLARIMRDVPPDAATIMADGPISGEGQVLGTAPYMAPEQLRGETVDARSDLFSLGIILYELATGRRPFNGDTSAEVTASILRDTPEPLSTVRADLPRDLERIIRQCLEKNVHARVQTAFDVNHDLRRLQKTLGQGGHGGAERQSPKGIASIAVLPFVNLSHDKEDEYFSDGLADEVLNMLAKIKGIRVTARSSAFTFKGKQATAPEIGRTLDVATLLEGSVRKAGNRIRVSVQLVSVSENSHLWSEMYDRALEDIFAVQDDIAHSVVKELRIKLLGAESHSDASGEAKAEVAQAAKGRGTDPEAHRLILLARHLSERFTPEDQAKAIGYLKEALHRDPEYAMAWVELGRAYSREASRGWVPQSEGYERARVAVDRGLALEPDLPEGYAAKAWIQMGYDLDLPGATASIARALKLSPANAAVLRMAGNLASYKGRLEEAIEFFRRAIEQDPLTASPYHNLGIALDNVGRFAEAEQAYQKTLELSTQLSGTRASLSMVRLGLGRGEEALVDAMSEPCEALRLWALGIIHHTLGEKQKSDTALRELIEKYGDGDMICQVAEVYAMRGEVDKAFECLERAYANRELGFIEIKASRYLHSLHDDLRWEAFLKKTGLDC